VPLCRYDSCWHSSCELCKLCKLSVGMIIAPTWHLLHVIVDNLSLLCAYI
jgi:hypothetical protein